MLAITMLKDNGESIRVKNISEINSTIGMSTQNSSNVGRKHRIAEQTCVETHLKKIKVENDKNIEETDDISETAIVERKKLEDDITDPSFGKEEKSEDTEKRLGVLSPELDVDSTSHPSTNSALPDIKPATMVKTEEATSTSRDSCKFGISCYRRNPMHRIEEAHPGDHDYKRPNYPIPPTGTPKCPYWDACYRRNPTHFQTFCHPPETDFAFNRKIYQSRLRQRRQKVQNYRIDNSDVASSSGSDLDDYDIDDPFIDDSDLDGDYVPREEEDDETSDECDKTEE